MCRLEEVSVDAMLLQLATREITHSLTYQNFFVTLIIRYFNNFRLSIPPCLNEFS